MSGFSFNLDLLAGHAGYIAGAFGMTAVLIAMELLLLRQRRRRSLSGQPRA
ncbi:heme exporter protein CcmD [Cupriavidus sp. BIS7]|uniref:heme exporter protein CcmD n=1 Tax=Cupriavidus sp. BIS7 TaxID=1217718 RepID=UPI0002F99C9C|nr:heme exporter protein CcmD [Cupriavidus sp. BIS7]